MQAAGLQLRFRQESAGFIEAMKVSAARLRENPGDIDTIHELFRYAHSIKSEADYLQKEEIATVAHDLESVLAGLRSRKEPVEDASLQAVESGIRRLSELLQVEGVTEEGSGARDSITRSYGFPGFTQFETSLLEEARTRGERLFRVVCEIDSEARFKRPRAFLIINNLELIASVVKVDPPMHVEEDDRFRVVTAFLTGGMEERQVRAALDVDEIVHSKVEAIDYPGHRATGSLDGMSREATVPLHRSSFHVESVELDEIVSCTDEIRYGLRTALGEGIGAGATREVSAAIEAAERLHMVTRSLKTRTMQVEFERLRAYVEDMAAGLGKSVEVGTKGGDIEIDRRVAETLAEPLLHIVRNAIDHGIEPPGERKSAGKSETGHLRLEASLEDGSVKIVVSDDGRGISEQEIRSEARSRGLEIGEDEPLISVLSRPGFTTRSRATSLSGRGVGMDLILRRIRAISGEVDLATTPGRGTILTLSVPRGATYQTIMLFRTGNTLFGIPRQHVERLCTASEVRLQKDRDGFVWADSVRAYVPDGSKFPMSAISRARYAIFIRFLKRRGCLLVGELLFEYDLPEEIPRPADGEPWTETGVLFGELTHTCRVLRPTFL